LSGGAIDMTEEIESYGELEVEISTLLQRAKRGGLDTALVAGILLDYRDHVKMKKEIPELPAGIK